LHLPNLDLPIALTTAALDARASVRVGRARICLTVWANRNHQLPIIRNQTLSSLTSPLQFTTSFLSALSTCYFSLGASMTLTPRFRIRRRVRTPDIHTLKINVRGDE
jgi:hypothetical protein